jgi:hypothetical protein
MPEEPPKPPPETPAPPAKNPPAWVRPASYVLIGLALFLTVAYDSLSNNLGVAPLALQIGAIGCLIIGVVLFLLVRDATPVDRISAYREVFKPENKEGDSKNENLDN